MLGRLLKTAWLLRRAQRWVVQGRCTAALQALEQARALRPQHVGLALHHALTLAELHRLPEAVQVLQHAVTLQPTHPVLPIFLARLYYDQAQYPEAAQWCTRALHRSPTNCHALALHALIALANGQVQQGIERLLQPVPLPITALERACLWLARGRMPSLLQQANTAMQSRMLLCIETFLLRHPTQTHTLARQVLDTTASQANTTLADRLLGALDHVLFQATEQFIRQVVIRLRQLSAVVRYVGQPSQRQFQLRVLQAEAAAYRGEPARAQALYTQVAKQAPDIPLLQERLREVCYAQGKFAEALRHWRRALAQEPEAPPVSGEAALVFGELLCQVGEYQEASTVLTPERTGTLCDYRLGYYRGLCALQAGAPQEAQHAFAQALQQRHPDIVTLRLTEMARLLQGNRANT